MIPNVAPQLVASDALAVLHAAIRIPTGYALEPKVDGVRGLISFEGDSITVPGRRNLLRRSWLASRAFRRDLDAFAGRVPAIRNGSVLDGELFAGVDRRHESWEARRERPERMSIPFTPALELSPLVEQSVDLGERIVNGELEGIVLKDRTAP